MVLKEVDLVAFSRKYMHLTKREKQTSRMGLHNVRCLLCTSSNFRFLQIVCHVFSRGISWSKFNLNENDRILVHVQLFSWGGYGWLGKNQIVLFRTIKTT